MLMMAVLVLFRENGLREGSRCKNTIHRAADKELPLYGLFLLLFLLFFFFQMDTYCRFMLLGKMD